MLQELFAIRACQNRNFHNKCRWHWLTPIDKPKCTQFIPSFHAYRKANCIFIKFWNWSEWLLSIYNEYRWNGTEASELNKNVICNNDENFSRFWFTLNKNNIAGRNYSLWLTNGHIGHLTILEISSTLVFAEHLEIETYCYY